MRYYTFYQNNSGGYSIRNADVADYVIIQAENEEVASDRLYEITEEYSEYCPCCGERWNGIAQEGTNEPTIYGDSLEVANSDAIIYHMNGLKEVFTSS